jgi:hypothetical protein
VKNGIASLLAFPGPDESLGKEFEHLRGLLVVVLLAFSLPAPLIRVCNERLDAAALLLGGERLSINLNHPPQISIRSLGDPLLNRMILLLIILKIEPVGVIGLVFRQLVAYGLLNVLPRVLRRARRDGWPQRNGQKKAGDYPAHESVSAFAGHDA